MSRAFVGSIDCGTTSSRFIIFDKDADVVASHQIEYEQIYPKPGWHEQRPEDIAKTCFDCVDKAVEKLESSGRGKASDIKVIGITNQRETTVVWSRKTGKPLHNALVWSDRRNTQTVRELAGKSDRGTRALAQKTGLPFSTYFSGVKLRWLIDNVQEVKESHDSGDLIFGTVDTWLLYNFTGGKDGGQLLTDVTNASRTMFMNLETLQWDADLIEYFGIDKRCIAAKIVSNAEVYGEMASCALKGVPIAGMIGDQQGALVGQKCFGAGHAKNTYGTGAFLLYNTGRDIVPSKNGLLTTVGYKIGPDGEPAYALEGSIAVAGSSVQWCRDKLKIIERSEQIGDLAAQVEDTGGVYFVTGFSGLFAPYWDDSATGVLVGITGYTDRRHIARATLEATCFQSKAILDAMREDSGVELTALRVDGGMTNSDVAMQIQADIIGIDVDRPKMTESTALGSAIMAATAVGLFGWDARKPKTLDHLKAHQTVFRPMNGEDDRKERFRKWNRAVDRAKGWNEEV